MMLFSDELLSSESSITSVTVLGPESHGTIEERHPRMKSGFAATERDKLCGLNAGQLTDAYLLVTQNLFLE